VKYFITGGAGFIGSNLTSELLKLGEVTVYDNLSLGKKEFIAPFLKNNKLKFIEADLLNFDLLKDKIANHDVVFHLAANSDISKGAKYTDIDLKNGTLATYNVLEAMRINKIKKLVFSSSSAIYGEATQIPTKEDYGPLLPISLYGASKLACEGLISAFCRNYDMQSWIFRFANIIGKNSTHGVIFDFIKKLEKNPKELEILGNGKQSKPYLEVNDCISGMLYALEHTKEQVNYYNLGCRDFATVDDIAELIIEEKKLDNVKIRYTGGKIGWTGDVPKVLLDVSKMKNIGWSSKFDSKEAVRVAVKELLKNG
jgi:UDP-glucose 4-epimerase